MSIAINGQTIAGTSWSGQLGGLVHKGGNPVTLTVRKAGCAEVTKSLLINVTWDSVDCKYLVSLGSKANLASAELTETIDLFTSSGTGLPLGLKVLYLSQDGNTGVLGRNWTHNYNISLIEDDFGTVAVRKGNGQWALYTPNGTGYSSRPGDSGVLTKDAAGLFTLTHKDGTRYIFGANRKIASIADRNGNALTFTYSGDDLIRVSDGHGRSVTFSYAAGKLTAITDPAGNVYSLSVGASLNGITMPDGGNWQFDYQDNALLTAKRDPVGNLTTYKYDEQQRVIGSIDPEGRSRSIVYPTKDNTQRTTAFTEKDGAIWLYTYDVQSGDLTAKTDPNGNVTSYTYDAAHNQTSKTDASGTTTFSYDAAGNLTSTTDPTGNTTTYTYNAFGQVTSVTDPTGATTTYDYDAQGNLLKTTTPEGSATVYDYDAAGRLTSITTVTGETTRFGYDSQGNLASVTGPDRQTTTFAYDANGRRISSTDTDGNVTRFEYDAHGRLVTVIDAQGNTTRSTYDANGNRTQIIDANGRATTYAYNFAGQMVSMADALGHTTTFAYGGSAGCSSCGGGVDKMSSLTDAKGQATWFQYDPLGRLIKETDPLGHLTEYTYDAAGRVTGKTDPNGSTIHYSYDPLGRLTAKTYPDGSQTTFGYDAKGNLITAANASIAYSFGYDRSDRMTSVSNSFGHRIDNTYDAAGRRTRLGSNTGLTIDYAYDTAGRLAQIASPAGIIAFGYDDLGRRSRLAFPNGVTTSYLYDDLGRLTDLVSRTGTNVIAENHYTHDKVGNRLSNRGARATTSYGYDAIYRLTEAVGNTPGFSNNTAGKGKGLATATQNQKEVYVYDPVGNRLHTDKVRSYTHNAGNELLSADGTRYTYDANGNRTSKTTATGTTTYLWDAENRLTQVTLPDGKSVAFAYDPFGRRISKTADGVATRYTYDTEDILFETENGSAGNIYIHGPGSDEPLTLLDNKGPIYYHADGLGSIIALTDSAGKVVQMYEYDSFGQLKDLKNKVKQPFNHVGKEYDREVGFVKMGFRYYDQIEGRFMSEDPARFIDGTNLFAYVQNNPINYTDPFGLSATSNDSCFVDCWKKCIDNNYGSSFKTALGLSYLGVPQIVQEIYNGVVSIAAADKLKSLSLEGAFTSGNIVEKMQAAEKASCAAKSLSAWSKVLSVLSKTTGIVSAGATGYVVGASSYCTGKCL